MLRLQFVAGKEYEVSVVHGKKTQLVFAVKEKGANTVLADSERAPGEFAPLGQTDWLAGYSYSGTRPPRSEERHGVGVLRQHGDAQYVLCFERIGAPLASEELESWQKRLLDAPLR